MIRGTMTSQDGKTIFCTCEHHKVSVPTQKAHLLHRVPWDDLWDKDGNVEGKPKLWYLRYNAKSMECLEIPDSIFCEDLFLVQARDVETALSEWSEVWQKADNDCFGIHSSTLFILLRIALLISNSRWGIVYPDHLFSTHLYLSNVIMPGVSNSKLLRAKAINQFELCLKWISTLNALLYIRSESILHNIEPPHIE